MNGKATNSGGRPVFSYIPSTMSLLSLSAKSEDARGASFWSLKKSSKRLTGVDRLGFDPDLACQKSFARDGQNFFVLLREFEKNCLVPDVRHSIFDCGFYLAAHLLPKNFHKVRNGLKNINSVPED